MVDDLLSNLSDHCKISFAIPVLQCKKSFTRKEPLQQVPPKFKWHENASADIKIHAKSEKFH